MVRCSIHRIVTQANHAFGALVNDSRLVYDSKQRTLTYRSMLVSQSNVPNSAATAVGVQADTKLGSCHWH
jgi:hypothetical protein